MHLLLILIIGFFVEPSYEPMTTLIDTQTIIDKCIEKHGGSAVGKGQFSFEFRKHNFTYKRNGGIYEYTRTHKETLITDILSNEGFQRMKNERPIELTEKQINTFSNSLNSVQYFAFLPYFLNDEAVHKELIGETEINGKSYYKIKVTFDQNGGGDDHDDIYMYWIQKDDFTLDYLAYSFHINGGGVRFRSAYNQRMIGGVTFQDYVNYKHEKGTPVKIMDELYKKGELVELSKIELKNIQSLD